MAYTRHDWVCGETVTEQKMNNLEDGIEEALECCSEALVLELIGTRQATAEECADGGTVFIYNHTWQEVYDALPNVILGNSEGGKTTCLWDVFGDDDYYEVHASQYDLGNGMQTLLLFTESADGTLISIECHDLEQ